MATLQQGGTDITVVQEVDLNAYLPSVQDFTTLTGKTVVAVKFQESTGVVQEVSKESWE